MKTFAVMKTRFSSTMSHRLIGAPFPTDCGRHTERAAVREILRGPRLQAKLTIGALNDIYEQEADRVADQVMRMPDANANIEFSLSSEELPLQRRVPGNGPAGIVTAPALVQNVLSSPGQPLDTFTRKFFEPRFGHDFGHVRIHTDENAGESAASVNAAAYAVGSDIVFARGLYWPGRATGRMLIAHELAHVVQMSKGGLGRDSTLHRRKNEASSDEGSLPSQVNFIVDQLDELKKRSAWTGINRHYRAIESLGDEAFDFLSNSRSVAEVAAIHDLGAQAARSLGDIQGYERRLQRQLKVLSDDVGHIDDAAERPVLESLTLIKEHFGAVRVGPRSEPKSEKKREQLRGPELVQVQGPTEFDPLFRRSVEFAAGEIASKGYFTGLIPAGEYKLGDQVFTVIAGTKTTDAKVLTVLW